MTPSTIKCRENLITIEQYRSRSVVRAVIVRFPSERSEYYFVQFRWFYRSWIESEMFTLDRWRTDLIILIDDQFSTETRLLLQHLDCHKIINEHLVDKYPDVYLLFINYITQRSKDNSQFYTNKYSALIGLMNLMIMLIVYSLFMII